MPGSPFRCIVLPPSGSSSSVSASVSRECTARSSRLVGGRDLAQQGTAWPRWCRVNRNTLTALELGKPGTAIGVCFTVLWALGLEKSLDAVADPDTDVHGKAG